MKDIFREVAANMQLMAETPGYLSAVESAIDLIANALTAQKKLLVFGNGGSAADAEHVAAEFVCRFAYDRPALPALALSTNYAMLTATSNDLSFAEVFARQVDAYGVAGDVAWGISTSGKSPNVVRALTRARERGLRTIGLCGRDASELASLCDVILSVPLQVTARIQEVHLVTAHVICSSVEARLFPR